MYVERAADDEMCIYCLGVNKHFFLYFVTIRFTNVVLKESL